MISNSVLFLFCVLFLTIKVVYSHSAILFSFGTLAHNMKGKKGLRCPEPTRSREMWPPQKPLQYLLLFLDYHVP